MTHMNEPNMDVCEVCEGAGKVSWSYHQNDPHPFEKDCSHCGATGYIEREAQERGLTDLEECQRELEKARKTIGALRKYVEVIRDRNAELLRLAKAPLVNEPAGNPPCPGLHADPPSHADNGHRHGPWCSHL